MKKKELERLKRRRFTPPGRHGGIVFLALFSIVVFGVLTAHSPGFAQSDTKHLVRSSNSICSDTVVYSASKAPTNILEGRKSSTQEDVAAGQKGTTYTGKGMGVTTVAIAPVEILGKSDKSGLALAEVDTGPVYGYAILTTYMPDRQAEPKMTGMMMTAKKIAVSATGRADGGKPDISGSIQI